MKTRWLIKECVSREIGQSLNLLPPLTADEQKRFRRAARRRGMDFSFHPFSYPHPGTTIIRTS